MVSGLVSLRLPDMLFLCSHKNSLFVMTAFRISVRLRRKLARVLSAAPCVTDFSLSLWDGLQAVRRALGQSCCGGNSSRAAKILRLPRKYNRAILWDRPSFSVACPALPVGFIFQLFQLRPTLTVLDNAPSSPAPTTPPKPRSTISTGSASNPRRRPPLACDTTEQMSLTEKAVEFAWNKLKSAAEKTIDDEAKDSEKSLLTALIKRIQPTARERTAKSLLLSFARLFENQFHEHQIFADESSQLAADMRTFLANPSVQGWLAEPLDLSTDHLDHQRLAGIWRDLHLTPLPEDFEWELIASFYLVKVRSVIQKDPELRAIADSDVLRQLRDAMNRLAGLDPGFRLQEYRSRILTRFAYLKFDSFHVTGSDLERRVQLWKVFVPQHVKENLPPLELPKEHIRKLEAEGEISPGERRQLEEEGQLQLYRQRYQEAPRQVVIDLLHSPSCPYAVIVGDPGSGKSTLLEWLLLEWAEDPKAKAAPDSWTRPLPLFVELRQCARESADWKGDFCQYFAVADDPLFAFNAEELQKHLASHDAVLLIDGLDEVFDLNQRKQITDRVLNFKSRFPRCRVVVTSRQIGFQKEVWLNNGFRLFTLQDFDLPQIELFLERWHQLVFALDPAEVQRLKPRLLASIREYLPIRELAANPLLLTMMAVINRMEPIPRDRRALYERCAELLVHRWEVDRGRMAGPRGAEYRRHHHAEISPRSRRQEDPA